ncbi:MAG TPA: ATP-dependent DNA helicase [Acidimicrobiales bacterium]|nr:ATP-dependent DNA helicase [Acidimicrobiales bacterium]
MKSFDPDDETVDVEAGADDGVQLDDDVVEVDAERALALLDAITHDLPGGGESRDGQREMVRAVASAISRRRHHVIEAGTGVGKSLAYLVPAVMAGERVVIATATKNLQDQLAKKDAPQVAAHVKGVRVAVLKGKQNYLCRNRAQSLGAGAQLSLDDGVDVPKGVADQMRRILRWSNDTETGDLDELPFEVDSRARRSLSVTPQECLGRTKCPQGANCFAELAKDRANESSILIVNAHLYASHLASGSMLLPAHEFVVFDEAHEILDIFATLLGTSLNAARLRALATGARSLLDEDDRARADQLLTSADRLASALLAQYERNELKGLDESCELELARANELVSALVEGLRGLETASSDAEFRKVRALGPAIHLANDLERVNKVKDGELLFLSRRDREIDVEISLVDVGPRLRDDLWGNVTAVLTSATIPDTLPRDLGLDDCVIDHFASPFDYPNHGLLYVPENFPERNAPGAEAAIIEELVELITAANGRTLALFTNRSVMQRVAEAVEPRLDTEVLVQGTLSRARLIELFRHSAEASLFAVTSFWQGIDVPGHSLSLVTIDRLPFSVPNDPLAEARREKSDHPFFEVDLPRATMLLAQGVGRLIRTKDDRGVVAVLDTRLATARYRGTMFKKLPPMRRTRDKVQVHEFLKELQGSNQVK